MNNTPFWYYFLTVYLVSLTSSFFAQEAVSINYKIENGLPSNEVYDLFEDQDGYVWIGTDRGAIRFDGSRMLYYSIADGLADKDVLSIHQSRDGAIWFLSYNGKLSYLKEGIVYNEENDSRLKKINANCFFSSFLEDSKGNLWFGTYKSGIYQIKASGEVKQYTKLFPNEDLQSQTTESDAHFGVTHLFLDKNSKVGFIRSTGTYLFDGNEFQLSSRFPEIQRRHRATFNNGKTYSNSRNQLISFDIEEERIKWNVFTNSKQINRIQFLSDGLLYVATDKGLYRFKEDGTKVDSLLFDKKVSDALVDREGNLWVSTLVNGVFLFPNKNMLLHSPEATYSVLKFDDSFLFGGTGLSIYSTDKKRTVQLPINFEDIDPILNQDRILCLVKDQEKIWIGSDWGLYSLEENAMRKHFYFGVKDIVSSPKKPLVLTINNYLLELDALTLDSCRNLYNSNELTHREITRSIIQKYRVSPDKIYCLTKTAENSILSGTDNGILVYKEGQFNPFEPRIKGKVIDIKTENNYDLWVLQESNGLYYYDAKKRKLDSIALFQLEGKVSYKFLRSDDEGKMWVGTNKGLVYVERNNGNFTTKYVNKQDVNDMVSVKDTLWLASPQGIISLPKNFHSDTLPPLIYLDSVYIDEQKVVKEQIDESSIVENTLSAHFNSISFNDQGDVIYQYELEGDSYQSGYSTSSNITFKQLNPSNYLLRVIAIDSHQNKSKVKEIRFTVGTMFWKKAYFWIVLLIGFLTTPLLIIRFRYKRSPTEILDLLNGKIGLKPEAKFILVKSVVSGSMVKIFINDLHYIKASKDYMELITSDKNILIRSTMKELDNQLENEESMLRVHRSYIVNLDKIQEYKSGQIKILDHLIPISKNTKQAVKEYLRQQKNN